MNKYTHGDDFTATIEGRKTKGRISFVDGRVRLCQNDKDGTAPNDRLGYNYGWDVISGSSTDFKNNGVKNLVMTKSKKPLPTPKLTSYDGYNLSRTTKTVAFGCGAVTVQKADLKSLATFINNKTFVANLGEIRAVTGDNFNTITIQVGNTAQIAKAKLQLIALGKIMGNKAFTGNLAVLQKIAYATRGRRTLDQLLKISPETYLKIAG